MRRTTVLTLAAVIPSLLRGGELLAAQSTGTSEVSLNEATKGLEGSISKKGGTLAPARDLPFQLDVPVESGRKPPPSSGPSGPAPSIPPLPVTSPVPKPMPGPSPFMVEPEDFRKANERWRELLEQRRARKELSLSDYVLGMAEYRRRVDLYQEALQLRLKDKGNHERR
jgi:hypothetical protein